MSNATISIAKDFSDTPAGRYRSDSTRSGEAFREDLLEPALRKGGSVMVDLDGTLGFGSSFLEEAFGGLVRSGLNAEDLHLRLKVHSSVPVYARRVWQYIDDEARRRG